VTLNDTRGRRQSVAARSGEDSGFLAQLPFRLDHRGRPSAADRDPPLAATGSGYVSRSTSPLATIVAFAATIFLSDCTNGDISQEVA